MKRILMVLTSHKNMEHTESKTGVWLGEFTDPYYEFIDEIYDVVLASPKGGRPPIDPLSQLTENITSSNRRFKEDERAQQAFNGTFALETIDHSDFDAIFFPGGHGPLWDLAKNEHSGHLIIDFYNSEKPVAAVCHGPAALLKADELQTGFLKGKKITAFTNTEETMVARNNNIPFKLETRLKELGADFHAAFLPFTSKVVVDGLLVTGQNPASAGPTAQALIKLLKEQINNP